MMNNGSLSALGAFLEDFKKEVYNDVYKDVYSALQEELKPEFYNIKQLSKLLSITESGVKARIRSGKIKGYKDGNVYLVSRVEVDRYIAKIKRKQV